MQIFKHHSRSHLTPASTSAEQREALMTRVVTLANVVVRLYDTLQTDADSLEQLTRCVCAVCDDARTYALLAACVQHFECCVSVGVPAPGAVRQMLASLCRCINVDRHARTSWDVVRSLLNLPYYARIGLRALCSLLNDTSIVKNKNKNKNNPFICISQCLIVFSLMELMCNEAQCSASAWRLGVLK